MLQSPTIHWGISFPAPATITWGYTVTVGPPSNTLNSPTIHWGISFPAPATITWGYSIGGAPSPPITAEPRTIRRGIGFGPYPTMSRGYLPGNTIPPSPPPIEGALATIRRGIGYGGLSTLSRGYLVEALLPPPDPIDPNTGLPTIVRGISFGALSTISRGYIRPDDSPPEPPPTTSPNHSLGLGLNLGQFSLCVILGMTEKRTFSFKGQAFSANQLAIGGSGPIRLGPNILHKGSYKILQPIGDIVIQHIEIDGKPANIWFGATWQRIDGPLYFGVRTVTAIQFSAINNSELRAYEPAEIPHLQ